MGLLSPSRGQITWGGVSAVPPTKSRHRLPPPGSFQGIADIAGHGRRLAQRWNDSGLPWLARSQANPAVLFLDEPTASLDPGATNAIENIIRTVAESGVKVVMATHDLGEARRLADDIIFLHRGRVIESGDAQAFFRSPQTDEAKASIAADLLL